MRNALHRVIGRRIRRELLGDLNMKKLALALTATAAFAGQASPPIWPPDLSKAPRPLLRRSPTGPAATSPAVSATACSTTKRPPMPDLGRHAVSADRSRRPPAAVAGSARVGAGCDYQFTGSAGWSVGVFGDYSFATASMAMYGVRRHAAVSTLGVGTAQEKMARMGGWRPHRLSGRRPNLLTYFSAVTPKPTSSGVQRRSTRSGLAAV